MPPWSASFGDEAGRLGVDPALGLTPEAARERLRTAGPNRLREVEPPSPWRILVGQFRSAIVALLGAAALAAFAFGEELDGAAILVVLALNALIGFVTELRAVRSMTALRSLGSVTARVRRGGRDLAVPATELVPGDVVLLEAGDVVTADVRLGAAPRLEVDESTVTGESVPVAKSPEPVAADAPLAERASMVLKGTAVTRGSGEGVVVATGMETELGRIARLVEATEDERTPLELQLSRLGGRLVQVTIAVAAVTAVLGMLAGHPVLLMVETGIALAVAAIPEGLPIVATMALARGMWRMARRHALVERLSAVETLGATTVVCTDKTGTLTENRMVVRRLVLDGARLELAGGLLEPEAASAARAALEAAVLCNNASLDGEGVGDPMEVALLRAGRAAGIERAELLAAEPEVREEPFDPETRVMATVHAAGDGLRVAAKGAAEDVVRRATSVRRASGEREGWRPGEREAWLATAEELAAEGLRVLGVAEGSLAAPDGDPFADLALVALVALFDPPRADVRAALASCAGAGIRVVMVTGDHAATAASIARDVGLLGADEPAHVAAGAELDRLADLGPDERARLLGAPIFARVSPEQKLDLVAAYRAAGEVVAMTGDGVNDAPALKRADIGIAMGRRGTQVAREAADMVLTDDAFASIVAAVEEGRVIFGNIRKFVFYLMSCNLSEVMVVALAAAVTDRLPLLPLQILFLNLVTDVFPALALAFGAGDGRELARPPRDPAEPILGRRGWLTAVGFALVISLSVLGALHLAESVLGLSPAQAVTVSFLSLAFAQLLHVWNVRETGTGVWRNDVLGNPWMGAAAVICTALLVAAVHVPLLSDVLRTADPGPRGWALVGAASVVPLVLGQLWKSLAGRGSSSTVSP